MGINLFVSNPDQPWFHIEWFCFSFGSQLLVAGFIYNHLRSRIMVGKCYEAKSMFCCVGCRPLCITSIFYETKILILKIFRGCMEVLKTKLLSSVLCFCSTLKSAAFFQNATFKFSFSNKPLRERRASNPKFKLNHHFHLLYQGLPLVHFYPSFVSTIIFFLPKPLL